MRYMHITDCVLLISFSYTTIYIKTRDFSNLSNFKISEMVKFRKESTEDKSFLKKKGS